MEINEVCWHSYLLSCIYNICLYLKLFVINEWRAREPVHRAKKMPAAGAIHIRYTAGVYGIPTVNMYTYTTYIIYIYIFLLLYMRDNKKCCSENL